MSQLDQLFAGQSTTGKVVTVAILVLALVGLLSVAGWVIGTVFWLLRVAAVVAVVVLAVVVIKAFVGSSRRS